MVDYTNDEQLAVNMGIATATTIQEVTKVLYSDELNRQRMIYEREQIEENASEATITPTAS